MIVGISGKMAAGKDHLLVQLSERIPDAVRVSFAFELRREIQEALEAPLPVLFKKPYSEPVRRLLQWWGTDFRRAQDPDYWVKKAEVTAIQHLEDGLIPVFTDVRFPNEAKLIRDRQGILVLVTASEKVREERLGMAPPNHESETALDSWDDWDYVIDSSGLTEDYLESVERVAARIRADMPA